MDFMGEGEKLSKNQLSLRAKRGNPRLTERLCIVWDCHASLAMTIVYNLNSFY